MRMIVFVMQLKPELHCDSKKLLQSAFSSHSQSNLECIIKEGARQWSSSLLKGTSKMPLSLELWRLLLLYCPFLPLSSSKLDVNCFLRFCTWPWWVVSHWNVTCTPFIYLKMTASVKNESMLRVSDVWRPAKIVDRLLCIVSTFWADLPRNS